MLFSHTTPAQETALWQVEETNYEGLHIFNLSVNRAVADSIKVRNTFKEYFSNVAPVPWQLYKNNKLSNHTFCHAFIRTSKFVF